MSNQLIKAVNESGLDSTKAKVLLDTFSNYFEVVSEWEQKSKELVVNNISQVAEMKLAREGRLFLKDKRVLVEKTRKSLKETALREGQTIDAIAKILTNLILPIEQDLEQKEKFKEIEEKRIKDELRQSRFSEIEQYSEFVPINIDLSDLTEIAFNTIKTGAKAQYEAKIEEQRKADEEREKQQKISFLEQARKNELRDLDLWYFIDEDTKSMNFGTMSDKYYNGLVADLKKRKEAKEKELERINEDRKKALIEKEIAEKKLADERKKAEAERKRLQDELDKKEKEVREAERIKQLEEDKARKEAIKLAKAPVKKQLKVWVESFDIADCPVQDQIGVDIIVKFEAFKKWSLTQIENI